MHTRSTVQCEYMYIVKLIQYTDVSKLYTICLTKGPRKNENITKELLIATQHICVLLFASVDNTICCKCTVYKIVPNNTQQLISLIVWLLYSMYRVGTTTFSRTFRKIWIFPKGNKKFVF